MWLGHLYRTILPSLSLPLSVSACVPGCVLVCPVLSWTGSDFALFAFFPPLLLLLLFLVHSTSAWGASTLAQRNLISKGHVWCRPRSVPAAPTSAPPSPPLAVPNHRRALRVRRPSAEAAGSLNLFFLLLHRLLALSLSLVHFKAKKHVLNLLIFHSHTRILIYSSCLFHSILNRTRIATFEPKLQFRN